MSDLDFSKQLEESFKNITTFFKEVSVLLKDCDRLMGENGYTTFNGNTAVYEISRSLLNPEGWVPTYLSRAYVDEEKLEEKSVDNVKFVSIFLRYGISGTYDIKMEGNIPLIVAGMLTPGNPETFKFEGWMTKRWFWANLPKEETIIKGDKSIDGSIVEIEYKNNSGYGTKNLKTFAFPMEEINNTSALKEKIINRLFEIEETSDL